MPIEPDTTRIALATLTERLRELLDILTGRSSGEGLRVLDCVVDTGMKRLRAAGATS